MIPRCQSVSAFGDLRFTLLAHQANEIGGSVRNGEHGQIVVFWKVDQIAKAGTETGPKSDGADEKAAGASS